LKSLRSPDHIRLIALLVAAREKAGMTQQALADRLGRPQSFVAKYEGGERRIDVIEFIAISHALELDPSRAVREIAAKHKPRI
jgi:transcriptional regulator with XRE-family HTH domain